MSDTMTQAPKVDLFAGTEIVGGFDDPTLVVGQDFFDDDPDPADSSYKDKGDPISQAVGTPGYMANHVVGECFREMPDGSRTEPPEFDRFYFPPQDLAYDGPAPVLIDVLQGMTPEEQATEREDKETLFKTEWCRSHNVSYIVLVETEDTFLSPDALRARIEGSDDPKPDPANPVEADPPAPETKSRRQPRGGVQRPRQEN